MQTPLNTPGTWFRVARSKSKHGTVYEQVLLSDATRGIARLCISGCRQPVGSYV